MYENLEQIANLKFVKEAESISSQTRETVKQMQNEYAALTGSSGVRSGHHEASIGRAQIEGCERLVRALFQIWVDLIQRSIGHISREDIAFIANKVESCAQTQKRHLHTSFSQRRMGAVVSVLAQEADLRMHAVAANARRDLEIMVREHEAFPNQSSDDMKQLQGGSLDTKGKLTRHNATVLNILIASPSDVTDERAVVEKAIQDWNATHFSSTGIILYPIRWESHAYPASDDRPQAIINRQIVESGDVLIAMFGYKLGTPTGAAQSGTIEEIEEFRKAGKYVALYFSTADVPRSADRAQLEALESYKKARQKDTLYFEFEDAPGLRDHLTKHLPKIVHEVHGKLNLMIDRHRKLQNPGPESENAVGQPWQMPGISTLPPRRRSLDFLPDLNPKEIELVVLAARDKSGQIWHRREIGREQLIVGNQVLLDSDDARSRAEWIGAIGNLVSLGLLEVVGQKGECYQLTDSGYGAADLLGDFARWSTNQVTIEAHYINASTESLTIACSTIVQLPAVYDQYRVRPDTDVIRTEKEPRSLLIEGVDLKALNEISWQPTDILFTVIGTTETKSFLVERTNDHRVAKFYVKGGG